ncbi:hypothetical protein CHUAL_008793 [Chamberlinius hualienensis]
MYIRQVEVVRPPSRQWMGVSTSGWLTKMVSKAQLDLWDYVTIALCVVLTSIPGVYYSVRRKKNAELKEFLAVNTKINFIPIILSAAATNLSAISILGLPPEAYNNGMSFIMWSFTTFLVIPMAVYLFIPVYFKINKSSIYEYLEMRFNTATRIFAALIMAIQVIFLTATGIYAPALAINQVTGLNLWVIVGVTGSASIIYTAIGGFKAVVWTDSFQFLVMTFAILLILIKGTVDVGGVNVIWERLVSGNRSQWLIWSESPHSAYTVWVFIIANPFQKIGYMVLNQSMMQRYLSNSTLKKAQTSAAVVLCTVIVYATIEILIGFVIYASYYDCDPLLNGQLKKRDQIIALFSVQILAFAKGLSGIFIGGLLCASISTVSSNINSLAIITISDFVTPFKSDLSEKCLLRLSKILVVIFGCGCTALVALIEKQSGLMPVFFSVISLASSPVITLVFTAMLIPWVNTKGALVGFFASMILPLWAWIGKATSSIAVSHAPFSIEGCSTNFTMNVNQTLVFYSNNIEKTYLEQFYSCHPFWYTIWSLTVGILVSLIVSKLTGFEKISEVNPDLFFPFVRNFIIRKNSRLSIKATADDKEMKVLISPAIKPLLRKASGEIT